MSSTSMYHQHRAHRVLHASKQQALPVMPHFETAKKADIKLIPPYISQAVEVIIDKLYWYSNRFPPNVAAGDTDTVIINIDEELKYLGYNKDFGPLNLAQVHKYCTQVQNLHRQGKRVVHHCTTHYQK
jgi:hypothetical protein